MALFWELLKWCFVCTRSVKVWNRRTRWGSWATGGCIDSSDALRHRWEHRRASLLPKSDFWTSRKWLQQEPQLALTCFHRSELSPVAAVDVERYLCLKLKQGTACPGTPQGHLMHA